MRQRLLAALIGACLAGCEAGPSYSRGAEVLGAPLLAQAEELKSIRTFATAAEVREALSGEFVAHPLRWPAATSEGVFWHLFGLTCETRDLTGFARVEIRSETVADSQRVAENRAMFRLFEAHNDGLLRAHAIPSDWGCTRLPDPF